MLVKLDGKVKESEVDLIILDNKVIAIHFKLENKILIYKQAKMSNVTKDKVIDKEWRPEVVYLDKQKFLKAISEFIPNLDRGDVDD